jgi:hypothetical protein
MDINKLSMNEKIFLAGCIKSMILSDNSVDDEEEDTLNQIIANGFTDFEDRLADLEDRVKDEEGFWEMARTITDKNSRKLITDVLGSLMIREGVVTTGEHKLIATLEDIWK